MNYANGILKFKIFKILISKKGGLNGDGGETDSEASGNDNSKVSGEKNIKAMLEEVKKLFEERPDNVL